MGNNLLTEAELGWLAGIFDGEGTCRIYKSRSYTRKDGSQAITYTAQVKAVSNTDFQIIERVTRDLEHLGLRGRYCIRRDGNTKNYEKPWWSPCADICISGYRQVETFLTAILPYATGRKKSHAEHVLAFVRMRMKRGNPGKRRRLPGWDAEDERFYAQQTFARARAPVN